MQEEFPDWFGSQIHQRHVDNDQDPEVSTTSELFALANGPSWTPISVNSCVVDGCPSVEDDPDITHFDNSSDLPLSTSLNDLDNATLHIDGQSTVVDAPPDIIDVPDEDDDIIDDEDALGLMNLAIFLMTVPLYYPSWEKVPKERKVALISNIEAAHGIPPLVRHLRRHQHALAKSLKHQQGFFQGQALEGRPQTGTYDVEAIRQTRPVRLQADEFESGGASGSGGCGDDEESGDDEDDDGDD
ncbi:hypothetical protein Tco_0993115 [Tanacetum coccineum]|uniref:Uncharacterized protein n=1 Tax=Tanacetum coccineum TaxID=301880 RepID=A0ABQ5F402_9ASTR